MVDLAGVINDGQAVVVALDGGDDGEGASAEAADAAPGDSGADVYAAEDPAERFAKGVFGGGRFADASSWIDAFGDIDAGAGVADTGDGDVT